MTSRSPTARGGRWLATFASTIVLVAGCGTSSASLGIPAGSGAASRAPQVASLPDLGLKNVTTETAQARGATIGREGGTITATATDGSTYSLAIPPGAVSKPTQVALYPVSSLAGLPQGAQLAAAVQFAPDGFELLASATLTIGLSAAPDRKSTRLNSSHIQKSRMPSSA